MALQRNDIAGAKNHFREESAKVGTESDLRALEDTARMLLKLQDDDRVLGTWIDRHWPKLPRASQR